MDTSTFDLYRVLQSGPYDEAGLSQVKRLIGGQRRLLRGKSDWSTLEQLIQMLQEWAIAAGGGWLSASALAEAAEIAELDLHNTARAEQLRSQAIVTGRAASGLPAAPPPVTNEGAIDANAELLHELKTLPPGALTQAFLTDAATEFEEEVRRSSSIPARPRTLPGAGPAAEAQRSSSAPPSAAERQRASDIETVPFAPEALAQHRRAADAETIPMTPPEAAERRRVADAETVPFADHTHEVQTIDLEQLSPLTSIPPRTAAEPVGEDALSAQIGRAEQELDSDTSPERVRELAELYVKRDEGGDREQAALLYTTLGEVMGNPAGIPMLERALSLAPEHTEAKALLTRYTVRQRMPITSPKITVLGMQPRAAAAIPQPPPAAARAVPPLAAAAVGQSSAVLSAAPSMPPLAAVPAPARPSGVPAARATLHGNGPANDVLPLHGVPQVVTTPPVTPQISSLSPVVRSDASQLQPESKLSSFKRMAVPGGLAVSVAAAFGLYFASHAHTPSELPVSAPSAKAVLTNHTNTPQVAAANQPLAAAPEVKAEPIKPAEEAAAPQADAPTPLAPPAPSHLPTLKIQAAKLSGGKLSEAQLSDAFDKAEPKFLACYAQASEKKPRMKGSVIYGFTVKPNGKVTNIKRVGGTLRDDSLTQCSVKVLEAMRFPKPRKQSAQVKVPIQYKRT